MGRALSILYSIIAYLIGMATIAYATLFVGDVAFVPHTVSRSVAGDLPTALLVDVGLLALFAVQHSGMARPGFKAVLTKVVPPAIERATFVLISGAVLGLMFACWRTLPGLVWDIQVPAARTAVWAVYWLGWFTVVFSTYLIDHFELFGLAQPWKTKKEELAPTFRTPLLYKVVRHPLYLGFLMAFWAAPTMTVSRLVFAVGATGYVFIGIFFEERDLVAVFGDRYRLYRKQVSMVIPWFPAASAKGAVDEAAR